MSGTPLTDAINALTTYSNTVTGASDTTLSEAVATLAAGYGGGGTTPQGLVSIKTIIAESAVSGTNNSTTVLNTLEPETLDTTQYSTYLFYFNNNTVANKAIRFAAVNRSGTNVNYVVYRTPERWVYTGAMDVSYSAGTQIVIIKFDQKAYTA